MREYIPPAYYLPQTRQRTYETFARVMGALWKDPSALSRLRPNEHQVIYRRFLLPRPEEEIPTQQEVGREMGGISRQRVSQLEYSARKRLDTDGV